MEPENKKAQKNSMRTFRNFIVLVAFFDIVLFLYIIHGSVYGEMKKFDLIPMPERYTELFFKDYELLPKNTVAGQTTSFTFVIHNLEFATSTYPYRVYFEYPSGGEVTFASGTVTVADQAYQDVTVAHTFLASNEEGEVVVELTSLDQQIDFLLPDTNQ